MWCIYVDYNNICDAVCISFKQVNDPWTSEIQIHYAGDGHATIVLMAASRLDSVGRNKSGIQLS
jgi:hypothetical protein